MADTGGDQLAGPVRAVGADHAAAGPAPGPGRDAGPQSADRVVSGAPDTPRRRAATPAGCERMTRQRPAARLLAAVAMAASLLAATLVAATVMRPAAAAPHYGFIT